MKAAVAEMMGLAQFDEAAFHSQIDHLSINPALLMTAHFKDGHTATYQFPSKIKKPRWTAEHRVHFMEAIQRRKEAKLNANRQNDTGNVFTDANVVETADALAWLLDTCMHRPTLPTPTVAVPCESCLNAEAVNAKAFAAHNGEKFRRLWSGDIAGFKSRSEADVALLSILVFWCNGDTEQMDRLFRQSGLMCEKWDEYRGADTYGNSQSKDSTT